MLTVRFMSNTKVKGKFYSLFYILNLFLFLIYDLFLFIYLQCSKEYPSCSKCSQYKRKCVYSPKTIRSPLTRNYLTKVEERVKKLEFLINDILPNQDIDALLSKSSRLREHKKLAATKRFCSEESSLSSVNTVDSGESSESGGASTNGGANGTTNGSRKPRTAASAGSSSSGTTNTATAPVHRPWLPSEETPEEADGFDWVEEDLIGNELTDGMAALSINPKGTGYFGLASSSVLLRALGVNSIENTPYTGEEDHTDEKIKQELLYQAYNMSSQLITDHLIDAFFINYNSSYPIIHEATYRAQYQGFMPKPRSDVWELLHNIVLALGSWCINPEESTMDLIYYQQARCKLNSSIIETGSLPLVQALTLLSNYVQKRNKPNTGWNYLGLAIRMALGLGLYREFPNWKSSPLKLEIRRRVWWVLFMFDAGAAVTFGRPINLPSPEIIDVRLPLNIDDNMLTSETVGIPQPVDRPTQYSGIIAQCNFCLLTNGIYNRLISNPNLSAEESLEFNKLIEKFGLELPPYFHERNGFCDTSQTWLVLTRYRLHWRIKNFQVILFRPFVLQRVLLVGDKPVPAIMNSDAEKECRRICLKAARETITLVKDFLDLPNLQQSLISVWYALYFLFQASLIPIICLSSEPTSHHAPDWHEDIQKTKRILLMLMDKNRLASKFFDVISRLEEQYLQHNNNPNAPLWMSDIYSLMFDFMKHPQMEGGAFDISDEPIIM